MSYLAALALCFGEHLYQREAPSPDVAIPVRLKML
jgi:hypothetical protein